MLKKLKSWKDAEPGWKSSYYRKNFILLLFIASIPGIISGIGLYWLGVGQIETELRKSHEKQIVERANNLNDQLDHLEVTVSYWAFDPRFNYSLTDLDFEKQFQETRDIRKKLMILHASNPLIENIEFYLKGEEPILFSPSYSVIKEKERLEHYQTILENNNTFTWTQLQSESKEVDSNQLALIHQIPGVSSPALGTLIVKINESKLDQLLATLTPYNDGATFLLNENNDFLISSRTNGDKSFQSFIKETILQAGGDKGSLTVDWKEETLSISYGSIRRISDNWTYISVAPITSITSPIVFISKLILLISFSGLIFAFIMTWFASRRIYHPIKKLLHVFTEEQHVALDENKDEFQLIQDRWMKVTKETENLQKRLSDQIPQLKQSFLLQLRKGYLYNYTEDRLRSRMESYGWKLQGQQFQLLDVQVTGIYESEKVMKDSDESLITFTLVNVIEECAKEYFEQFTVVNYHDLSVGVFLVTPLDSQINMHLQQFGETVTSMINRILEVKVTVTISKPVGRIKQIPHLFEKVSHGKRYRTFENKNQTVDLTKWTGEERDPNVFYPFETEKEVIQAVRRGKVSEAEQLIRQFIHELKDKDVHEIHIQTGVIQLFSMIQHEIFHSGIHPNELFNGKNMFEELSEIRELEWMVKWIIESVISPYVRLLEGRMDLEMKCHIEHIMEFIDQHYMEDISLEECADIVGTNPYTLSKAFKKVLNINFIDYLTTVRINKAKELLLTTHMKISEISESVGYRHSYFNRIFKKQVGVPPSQFRKMESSG